MNSDTGHARTPTVSDVLESAPPLRREPAARERIRAANLAAGRRIAVLDDDPTGSQTVHAVSVVTVLEPDEYAAGLTDPGAMCFVLANTRSVSEPAAVRVNQRVATDLFELGRTLQAPVEVVSRSDSTLRGHVLAEVRAIEDARRRVTGTGFDGVLLVPAYLEAGRFTAGDVHWAVVAGKPVPVGDTEFARDATFGYRSSNLREFVAEKSDSTVTGGDVHTLTLTDIRRGGPERVAAILTEVTGGAFVVVNATDYADLEIVVLGLQLAQAAGKTFGYRCGPSFPQVLAGLQPRQPLTADQIWPGGHPGGRGLLVVGSHVGLTSRQVVRVQERCGVAGFELDVRALVDARQREAHIADVSARVVEALASSDVLVFTSRTPLRGDDADESLAIARSVSAAVIDVVRAARNAHPSWVVGKGGITSHDVAVRGLGIRRAEVIGQLFPGMVSVFRPLDAAPEVVGVPYVVFAGNVGNDDTLADVVDLLRPGPARSGG